MHHHHHLQGFDDMLKKNYDRHHQHRQPSTSSSSSSRKLSATSNSSNMERSKSDRQVLHNISTLTEDEIETTILTSRKLSRSADDIELLVENDDFVSKFENDFPMWPDKEEEETAADFIPTPSSTRSEKCNSNFPSVASFTEAEHKHEHEQRQAISIQSTSTISGAQRSTVNTHLSSEIQAIKSTIDGTTAATSPSSPSLFPNPLGNLFNRRGALQEFSTIASSMRDFPSSHHQLQPSNNERLGMSMSQLGDSNTGNHRRAGSADGRTLISPVAGHVVTTRTRQKSSSPSPARSIRRSQQKKEPPSTPRGSNFRKRELMQKASNLLPDFDAMPASPQTPTSTENNKKSDSRPPTSSSSSGTPSRRRSSCRSPRPNEKRSNKARSPRPNRRSITDSSSSPSPRDRRRRSESRRRRSSESPASDGNRRRRHTSESPAGGSSRRRRNVSESPAGGRQGRRVLNVKIPQGVTTTPSPTKKVNTKLRGMLEGDKNNASHKTNKTKTTTLSPSSHSNSNLTESTTDHSSPVPTTTTTTTGGASSSSYHDRIRRPPLPSGSNGSKSLSLTSPDESMTGFDISARSTPNASSQDLSLLHDNSSYRTQGTEDSAEKGTTESGTDNDNDDTNSNNNRSTRGSLSLSTDETDLLKLNLSPKRRSSKSNTKRIFGLDELNSLTASPSRRHNPKITVALQSPSSRRRVITPSPVRAGRRLSATDASPAETMPIIPPFLSPLPGTEPSKTKESKEVSTPLQLQPRLSMDSATPTAAPGGKHDSSIARGRRSYGSDNICVDYTKATILDLTEKDGYVNAEMADRPNLEADCDPRETRGRRRRRSTSLCRNLEKQEQSKHEPSEIKQLISRRHSSSRSSQNPPPKAVSNDNMNKSPEENFKWRRNSRKEKNQDATNGPRQASKRRERQSPEQSDRQKRNGDRERSNPRKTRKKVESSPHSNSNPVTDLKESHAGGRQSGVKSPKRSRREQLRRRRDTDVDEPEIPATMPFREPSPPFIPLSRNNEIAEQRPMEEPEAEGATQPGHGNRSRRKDSPGHIRGRQSDTSSSKRRQSSGESPKKQRRNLEDLMKSNPGRRHAQSKFLCEIQSAGGSVASAVEEKRKASRNRRSKRQSRDESGEKHKSEGGTCGEAGRRSQERRSRNKSQEENTTITRIAHRKPSSERRLRINRDTDEDERRNRPRSMRQINK